MLLRREKEVPKHSQRTDRAGNQEPVRVPLSKETQNLIEKLKGDRVVVYETDGLPPRTLRERGMSIVSGCPELEDISTTPALIAFKPDPSGLFLPLSINLSYKKQLEILEERKAQVEKQYPGSGLKVREAVEWPELIWKHFQATNGKVRLFGQNYNYACTWMPVYDEDAPGAYRAIVGRWIDRLGLLIDFFHPDEAVRGLGLATVLEIPRV